MSITEIHKTDASSNPNTNTTQALPKARRKKSASADTWAGAGLRCLTRLLAVSSLPAMAAGRTLLQTPGMSPPPPPSSVLPGPVSFVAPPPMAGSLPRPTGYVPANNQTDFTQPAVAQTPSSSDFTTGSLLSNPSVEPDTSALPGYHDYIWADHTNFSLFGAGTAPVMPSPNAVIQGNLGDCFMLAPLIAVAGVGNGKWLASRYSLVTPAGAQSAAYNMQLSLGGKWQSVMVDARLLVSRNNLFATYGAHLTGVDPGPYAGYVGLFEKAYSKLATQFTQLNAGRGTSGFNIAYSGGDPGPVLTTLTGSPASCFGAGSMSLADFKTKMASLVSNPQLAIVLGTISSSQVGASQSFIDRKTESFDSATNAGGNVLLRYRTATNAYYVIPDSHALAIVGANSDDSFNIHNPWGDNPATDLATMTGNPILVLTAQALRIMSQQICYAAVPKV